MEKRIDVEEKIVLPGDFICTTEEYVPGSNTYNNEGGICSSVMGIVRLDDKLHKIDVQPLVIAPPEIKPDSIVLGRIILLKNSFAVLSIERVKGYENRSANVEGTIHISNIQSTYIKTIDKAFNVGDIVKAKVISDNPIRLTTSDKNLGVIKAFCPVCGETLDKKGKGLKCPRCNTSYQRKVSEDYGSGVF
ncbi:MAG TPA: exosome complex RNA-binding protein Csl4 [Halobacteria archaeon]|jgi:exosome complex component CSL4|nr:exosome complex RNA-binding protein Csl4 [Halobacteria archaeon]